MHPTEAQTGRLQVSTTAFDLPVPVISSAVSASGDIFLLTDRLPPSLLIIHPPDLVPVELPLTIQDVRLTNPVSIDSDGGFGALISDPETGLAAVDRHGVLSLVLDAAKTGIEPVAACVNREGGIFVADRVTGDIYRFRTTSMPMPLLIAPRIRVSSYPVRLGWSDSTRSIAVAYADTISLYHENGRPITRVTPPIHHLTSIASVAGGFILAGDGIAKMGVPDCRFDVIRSPDSLLSLDCPLPVCAMVVGGSIWVIDKRRMFALPSPLLYPAPAR